MLKGQWATAESVITNKQKCGGQKKNHDANADAYKPLVEHHCNAWLFHWASENCHRQSTQHGKDQPTGLN
jgi:hypothetical protein